MPTHQTRNVDFTAQETELILQAVSSIPLALSDPRHRAAHAIVQKIVDARQPSQPKREDKP